VSRFIGKMEEFVRKEIEQATGQDRIRWDREVEVNVQVKPRLAKSI
jgi:hypothetical protein